MWMGFFLLPPTPRPIYDRLVSALSAVAKDPDVAKKLNSAGFNIAYKNAQEFSTLINEQWDIFARVIKETDLKVD
jgi:tripartite-type tricarboxylate transporter receptor subunit TctC